jgi:simple sugar transport system ATP-binding protein
MRVWEACVLGAEARSASAFFRKRASRDRITRLSREWGFDLPVEAPSESLDAAGRQKAAVLAALLRNARVIIFDEVTAALNQNESEKIFALIKRLAAEGIASVVISHKLDETLSVAERASVFRKGLTAGVLDKSDFDIQTIISLMFGPNAARLAAEPAGGKSTRTDACRRQEAALLTENLSAAQGGYTAIKNINMELRGGTIYGLAGVRESGAAALLLTLSGLLKSSEGREWVDGKLVFGKQDGEGGTPEANTISFREAGGVYLGADGGNSIMACDKELSIYENMSIHAHRRYPHPNPLLARLGLLDVKKLCERTLCLMSKAGIDGPPSVRAGSLSGGMLQRLLVARELSENAVIILMSEPGWGLDTRRRAELYQMLEDECEKGAAVLLFLSSLDELMEFSSEIFVVTNGRIALDIKDIPSNGAETATAKNQINAAMCGAAV